ncbi:MAG: class I SAM-dependent methyltransferase [Actinomycetota bacterium]|nr:class I SAM-dependent methyltransferase [Actinomycetota bacterium]
MDDSPAPVTNEQFWDDRYRSAPAIWSGRPNPQLVANAADLAPGRALDIGAGEGADAIWLAERGWQVTAVDISGVALDRARAAAEQRGAEIAERITWVRADLAEWVPPVAAFELVSVQFMHLTSDVRVPLYDRCIAAVAPGGTALIVGHHVSDLQTTIRRPQLPDLYFEPADVAATLPGDWRVLEAGTSPRMTHDATGAEVQIHDAVLVARRAG